MKEYTIEAVRWFDKVNGNTYHSCRITRHKDGAELACPLQYGYGDQYRQTALSAMVEAGWLKGYDKETVYRYERENDNPIVWIVSDGLKREAIALAEMTLPFIK